MRTNLRDAECYPMSKASDSPSDADFPLVIKPRYGSGSKNVTVVLNAVEYEKYAARLNLKSGDFYARASWKAKNTASMPPL